MYTCKKVIHEKKAKRQTQQNILTVLSSENSNANSLVYV